MKSKWGDRAIKDAVLVFDYTNQDFRENQDAVLVFDQAHMDYWVPGLRLRA